MAKGNLAKEEVVNTIKTAFGDNFIAEVDKKLYVWANDGGERVQIAIALTCPKNPIGDATQLPKSVFAETPSPAIAQDVTPQEQEYLRALMERLGL